MWEGHAAFEVAAIVGRVGVEDDEGDAPLVDVFVDERDVGPGFFGELLELVHEDFLRHLVGRWEVVVRLWCGVGYLDGVVTAVPFLRWGMYCSRLLRKVWPAWERADCGCDVERER